MKPLKTTLTIAAMSLFIYSASAQPRSSETAASSAAQRAEMVKEFGITDQQAMYIQKFSWIRSHKIDSLSRLGLPTAEFQEKRDQATDEYYACIGEILTPAQRSQYNPEALKAARDEEIKRLNLPFQDALRLGELKAGYDRQVKEIRSSGLKSTPRKEKLEEAEVEYIKNVRNLLGNEKFADWQKYRNARLERIFMAQYGFTRQQFQKYQELENWQAIEILKIRNSSHSQEEKRQMILAVKSRKTEMLRKELPAEQFNRWMEAQNSAKAKRQTTKID